MSLTIWLLIAMVVPLACAVMSCRTGVYYYNLGVTGVCLLLLFFGGGVVGYIPLMACFAVSMLGDYFLGHQQYNAQFYLFGIIGFCLSHICLIWNNLVGLQLAPWMVVVTLVLAVGYGVYLRWRILPNVRGAAMQIAVCAYAVVSILALGTSFALNWPMPSKLLYVIGVALILFSDTIIAECDFADDQRLSRLIMPTYFGCHILITASALILKL